MTVHVELTIFKRLQVWQSSSPSPKIQNSSLMWLVFHRKKVFHYYSFTSTEWLGVVKEFKHPHDDDHHCLLSCLVEKPVFIMCPCKAQMHEASVDLGKRLIAAVILKRCWSWSVLALVTIPEMFLVTVAILVKHFCSGLSDLAWRCTFYLRDCYLCKITCT